MSGARHPGEQIMYSFRVMVDNYILDSSWKPQLVSQTGSLHCYSSLLENRAFTCWVSPPPHSQASPTEVSMLNKTIFSLFININKIFV